MSVLNGLSAEDRKIVDEMVEKLEAAIDDSSIPVEKLDLLSIIPPQEMQPLRHNGEAAQKSESELPATAPEVKMA